MKSYESRMTTSSQIQSQKPRPKRPKKSANKRSHRDRGGVGDHLAAELRKIVGGNLEAATFIVFDIETTGGNPERNGITEISALKIIGGEVADKFYSLVNPMIPIPPIVRRMTGITNQLVKDAPVIYEVFPSFVDFIGDHILVSHNTTGDLIFLRHFARETVGRDLRNFFLCTHLLVEKLVQDAPDKSLKGLSKHFAFEGQEFHRAEADAVKTWQLMKVLLGKLKERGVQKIEHAIRLQGDMDSALRLGWSIPSEKLDDLPQATGVFYLYDHERRLLFLSSAISLAKEVIKLRQYDILPRPVLKLALRSYDIKIERKQSLFGALLAECEGREKHHVQVDPALFHQRQVQVLGIYEDSSKNLRLSVGPIEAGLVQAFGPVKDRKRALDLIEDLAEILEEKITRSGMLISTENQAVVQGVLSGTLGDLQKRVEARLLRLKIMFWRRDALANERRRLDAIIALLGREGEGHSPWSAIQDFHGFVVCPDETPGNHVVHSIVGGVPKMSQVLKGDWSQKLGQGGLAKRLSQALDREIRDQNKSRKIAAGDLAKMNAVLWWNTYAKSKDQAEFIELQKMQTWVKLTSKT